MPTVRYTTVNGEIIAEKRAGVRRLYVPEPLGSTVALLDNTQAQTDSFSYWPYGEERTRTGTTPTPFRFTGTLGVYRDSASRSYARARELGTGRGGWLSRERMGPPLNVLLPYVYAGGAPVSKVDASGLAPVQRPPCDDRADAYCRAAHAQGAGDGLGCICAVAGVVCSIIKNKSLPGLVRRWFDCMNQCMFEHWSRGDTPGWRAANRACRSCSAGPEESYVCCVAQIAADQAAFTICESSCGPVEAVLPPGATLFNRPFIAALGCCGTGGFGGRHGGGVMS
jgi:hypothetical protein